MDESREGAGGAEAGERGGGGVEIAGKIGDAPEFGGVDAHRVAPRAAHGGDDGDDGDGAAAKRGVGVGVVERAAARVARVRVGGVARREVVARGEFHHQAKHVGGQIRPSEAADGHAPAVVRARANHAPAAVRQRLLGAHGQRTHRRRDGGRDVRAQLDGRHHGTVFVAFEDESVTEEA